MARPRIFKTPTRLSLSLDKKVKDKARKLANRNGTSIAHLFAQLINEAELSKV